jgi:hypothetical protein
MAAAASLAPVRRVIEAVVAEAVAEGNAPALPAADFEEAAAAAADQLPDAAAQAPLSDAPPDAVESADAAAPSQAPEIESPPIVPVDLETTLPPIEVERAPGATAGEEPHHDIETIAARRFPRPAKSRGWRLSLSRLQSGILALIILDAIVIGWRADFVRAMPQTASFYAWIGLPVNLRGLAFDGLATSTEQHENVPILVVEGNIVNDTHKMAEVPHLRFAVRNAARQEIYSWTAAPPRATLAPGNGLAFRTRLASPPPDAHDVLVRFLNRHDLMNGTR